LGGDYRGGIDKAMIYSYLRVAYKYPPYEIFPEITIITITIAFFSPFTGFAEGLLKVY
jgi:hypothetical protein